MINKWSDKISEALRAEEQVLKIGMRKLDRPHIDRGEALALRREASKSFSRTLGDPIATAMLQGNTSRHSGQVSPH